MSSEKKDKTFLKAVSFVFNEMQNIIIDKRLKNIEEENQKLKQEIMRLKENSEEIKARSLAKKPEKKQDK